MAKIPGFGWRPWVVSTLLAAIAAAMVLVLLTGDGGSDGTAGERRSTVPTIQLEPEQPVDPETVTFTEFDGREVLLSSLRGTPTVLNFFASTCTPCITEMPDLERVHQELGAKVTFVGLAVHDRIDAAQALIRQTGITYRTAQDVNGLVLQRFEGTGLPVTVLLDADGTPVHVRQGQIHADQLRSLLAEKLGITP